jgi:glyoxylase-like metal-dependent hydrolase (beta-lactamase superfamily II)
VEVIETPGHSMGGQSVLVETEKGKIAITGFCCIDKNFYPSEEEKDALPVVIPTIHVDPIMAFESMLILKRLADTIVTLHDKKYDGIEKIP